MVRLRAVDFLRYLLRSIRIEFRRSENLDALVQRKRGLIEEFLANALISDAVQKSVHDGFVLPLTEFAGACELRNRDDVIVERLAGFLIATIELVALELGVDFWFAVFSELRENRIDCDVSFRVGVIFFRVGRRRKRKRLVEIESGVADDVEECGDLSFAIFLVIFAARAKFFQARSNFLQY